MNPTTGYPTQNSGVGEGCVWTDTNTRCYDLGFVSAWVVSGSWLGLLGFALVCLGYLGLIGFIWVCLFLLWFAVVAWACLGLLWFPWVARVCLDLPGFCCLGMVPPTYHPPSVSYLRADLRQGRGGTLGPSRSQGHPGDPKGSCHPWGTPDVPWGTPKDLWGPLGDPLAPWANPPRVP